MSSTQRRRADSEMPARETEAIILKTFPLGEADRLVSFLGRASGRLRGVAGGARRVKNRYGSTLEVLSHVQIWYVEKETRELVRIQQCELLESFHKAQSNYELSTGLAVISETAELVLPDHEAVRLGGWLPRFDRCSLCGAEFGAGVAYHAPWEPGLLCEKCRRPGMKPLHLEARQLGERFAGERLDRIENAPGIAAALRELREAALNWIEHNSDRKLKTRELLETT